ncbi:MAG: hypothetical protein ACJA0Q_001168 [Saprospiraceae bacterium]|jgi:hypothetical protein
MQPTLKTVSFFIAVLLIVNQSVASDWGFKDVGEGIKPAVAVDSNNVPHVSFVIESGTGGVFHAKLDKSFGVFRIDTVSQGYFYGPADIEIDNMSNPHVSYHDHALNGGDLAHLAYNGSSWDVLPVFSSGHDGWDSEIAFDSKNYTHIVSIDAPVGMPGSGMEYAVYDGVQWTVEPLNTSINIYYGYGLGFQIDQNDVPHVSYYDDQEKHLYYANRSTGSWVLNKIDSMGDAGRYSTMVVDDMNVVHLCYLKTLPGDSAVIQYNYLSGGTWTLTSLDTVVGISSAARKVISLQMSTSGKLHIVYGTTEKIVYLEQMSTGWKKEVIYNAKDDGVVLGEGIRFKLDKLDDAHVVFYQGAANDIGWKVKYLSNADDIVESGGEKNATLNIQVYPNPFYSCFEIKGISEKSLVQIFNDLGQSIYTTMVSNSQFSVDLSEVGGGFYFVKVIGLISNDQHYFKLLKK